MARFDAVLVASLCLLALVGTTYSHDFLFVEGQIYCDTCHFGVVTRASEYIEGAKVRMECHNRSTLEMTYSIEGRTDSTGSYRIPVEGEHETDICEVALLESPRPDCNKIDPVRSRARILLSKNAGMVSEDRHANPLGVFIEQTLPVCDEIIHEFMGLA